MGAIFLGDNCPDAALNGSYLISKDFSFSFTFIYFIMVNFYVAISTEIRMRISKLIGFLLKEILPSLFPINKE